MQEAASDLIAESLCLAATLAAFDQLELQLAELEEGVAQDAMATEIKARVYSLICVVACAFGAVPALAKLAVPVPPPQEPIPRINPGMHTAPVR